MDDELLYFFERERAFLLEMGSEFARAHPRIAGRLKLGTDSVEDPHIGRLIESVALLNARVRKKLDDDFPEISHGLLEILYPQYLSPIPSVAVVQFECDPELGSGYPIPIGTEVETEPVDGQPVVYQTCYPTTALPLKVELARLSTTSGSGLPDDATKSFASVLRISLTPVSGSVTLGEMPLGDLRFFLRGQPRRVQGLYQLLFRNAREVALADGPEDRSPVFLGRKSLGQVGFDEAESLIPYNGRSLPGYGLITELFSFPHKFEFFEVSNLPAAKLATLSNRLELRIYFDRDESELEEFIEPKVFVLGCTPVVNRFRRRAEPIQVTQKRAEYRVVPDARRPMAHEVCSIDGVTATLPDGSSAEYHPFYGVRHDLDPDADDQTRKPTYYYTTRRPASPTGDERDPGTELYLSVVDLEYRSLADAGAVLDVEITCCSRNRPNRLRFGGGEPHLSMAEGGDSLTGIHCLTAPTKTLRPPLGRGNVWRLISQLSLGHLSLSDPDHGLDALQETLRVYDFSRAAENRAMIESIRSVASERKTMRIVSGGRAGVALGNELTIHFDESRIPDGGLFLFASVLERYLALHTTINSFTRLVATSDESAERTKVFHEWHPRAGERSLL